MNTLVRWNTKEARLFVSLGFNTALEGFPRFDG